MPGKNTTLNLLCEASILGVSESDQSLLRKKREGLSRSKRVNGADVRVQGRACESTKGGKDQSWAE